MVLVTQGYGPAGSPGLLTTQGYSSGEAVVIVSDYVLGVVTVTPLVTGLAAVYPLVTGTVTVNPGRGV